MGTLEKEGYTVKLQSGKVNVINGSRVILSGTRRDSCVYSLDGHAVACEFNASIEKNDSLARVWHKRRGHINEAGLWVLEKQGLLSKKSIGGYVFRFKHVAFGMFKEWKQLVENQTGRTVKKLRTDNGFEFLIMEYLVKISKKARILELKQRHLMITVLKSYTPYPSRKIRCICACTSLKTTKEQRSIRRI
ncbi:retrovirus-related pol polyprotein from transposon TNT 1-94 [Tanacetum coccineum]